MNIEAALVKEQGQTFAVVIVKKGVLDDPSEDRRRETAGSMARYFPGVPIVLMAQDSRGRPEYWGRRDIVDFLANVPFEALPWRRYTA